MHKTPLSRNEVLLEEILNKMGDASSGGSGSNDNDNPTASDEDIQDIIDSMYGGNDG